MGHYSTLPDTIDLVREVRNERLKECDWTQAADSPLSDTKKAEWATYRQQLRDMMPSITNEMIFASVVWPTPPQ